MTLTLLAEAAQEVFDAAAYYEEQQEGLGRRLEAEFHLHVSWILQNPTVPRLRRKRYRRVNLKVFPYYIAYAIRGDEIRIVAFGHGHRRPEYWIEGSR